MTVLQLATSIDNFIVGCKADGIWDAIKACCILGAWDNLSGALYPLKGAAPTNVGGLFVAGDYNRKTGLVGNGSSKYLNSNRANNADPQNNCHLSVFKNDTILGVNPYLIGSSNGGLNKLSAVGQAGFYSNSADFVGQTDVAVGLHGISRNNSSTVFIKRPSVAASSQSLVSVIPHIETHYVFNLNVGGTTGAQWSASRLAFYSIGESLNLALLDTRVNLLMAGIQVGVDGFDADAQAYITNVETADGQPLEFSVKTAINQFVVGCKADGIWNAIKASCILSGARTLNGALQPLAGTAPTPVAFVSGDYNRKTGLVGDGSTKYLNSNRAGNADPQDSNHLCIYATTVNTAVRYYAGSSDATTGSTLFYNTSSTAIGYFSRNSLVNSVSNSNLPGLIGISRNSSTQFTARHGQVSAVLSRTSQTPSTDNFGIFQSIGPGLAPANARLAFYSIGESLDLALLDARVTALITAFGVAIP